MYARPRLRDARACRPQDVAEVLQGRDVRRAARRRRAHATRRAPTSRSCATRASACRTSTATTRAGAMFGAGYAAAEDRLFFIDVLRHAGPRRSCSSFAGGANGNRAFDAEQWARRARTPRPTSSARSTSSTTCYGAEGAQIQRRRRRTTSRASTRTSPRRKLDPTKMPGEYAAIGRPQGPDAVEADATSIATAVAGRRDLRQGRRRRARARPQRAPTALEKRFGSAQRARSVCATSARPRTPRRRRPCTAGASPTRRRPKRAPAAAALARRGLAASARDVAGGATARRRGARGSAAPAASLRARLLASRSAMSNALLVSGARVGERPPARGFGPQVGYFHPQILMEQDVHAPAAGRHRRPRRRVPRRQPLRPARPRARLRVERDLGRPGHHRHVRARPLRPGGCRDDRSTTTSSAASACRSRCSSATNSLDADAGRPDAGRARETLRAERTKLGIVAGRGTIARQAGRSTRSCARPTSTRSTRARRLHATSTTPRRCKAPARLPARGGEDRLHVQLVLRRRRAHRLLQLRRQPGAARRASTTTSRCAAQFEWQGWNPDTGRRASRRSRSTRRSSTSPTSSSWNNKQAHGLPRRPTPTRSRRSTARSCSRTASSSGIAGAAQDDAAGAGRRDGAGRRRPTCARTRSCRWRCRSSARPADPAAARRGRQAARLARGGGHRRDHDRDGVYEHADAIRHHGRVVAALGAARSSQPALGAEAFDALTRRGRARQRAQQPRRAPRLGLPGRLVRLRAARTCARCSGARCKGRYSREYCGGGKLKQLPRRRCGARWRAAVDAARGDLYGGDAVCDGRGEGERPVVLRRGRASARSAAPPSR